MSSNDNRKRSRPASLPYVLGLGAVFVILLVVVSRLGPNAAERSDRLWSLLAVNGLEVESFTSLNEMIGAADAVVLGQIVAVQAGRIFGDPEPSLPNPDWALAHYATALVRVDEALGGDVKPGSTLQIELLLPDPSVLPELSGSLPGERGVYVLRNKGANAARLGYPLATQVVEAPFYRFVSTQGQFRDIDGRIRVPIASEEAFLLELQDQPFNQLLGSIRDIKRADGATE